jgi:hypothetical protein
MNGGLPSHGRMTKARESGGRIAPKNYPPIFFYSKNKGFMLKKN